MNQLSHIAFKSPQNTSKNTPQSTLGLSPKFGFGGFDEHGKARPLPSVKQYKLTLKPEHLRQHANGQITFSPALVEDVYHRVFRQDLTEPGMVLVGGIKKLIGDRMDVIRKLEVDLGKQLARLRWKNAGLIDKVKYTLKYVGRSNKAKKNPLHFDTQSSQSIVLMLYEPMKNIFARPFFTDITQFAQDKKITNEALLTRYAKASGTDRPDGYKVKDHYGHQIAPEHQDELMANYTFDLDGLDPEDLQLVVFNDSPATGLNGLAHGMRSLVIPNPDQPSERPFNHVVMDIPPGPDAVIYQQKTRELPKPEPVSQHHAISDYIGNGRIYYRTTPTQ